MKIGFVLFLAFLVACSDGGTTPSSNVSPNIEEGKYEVVEEVELSCGQAKKVFTTSYSMEVELKESLIYLSFSEDQASALFDESQELTVGEPYPVWPLFYDEQGQIVWTYLSDYIGQGEISENRVSWRFDASFDTFNFETLEVESYIESGNYQGRIVDGLINANVTLLLHNNCVARSNFIGMLKDSDIDVMEERDDYWSLAASLPSELTSSYVDLLYNGSSYVVVSSDKKIFSGESLSSLKEASLPINSSEYLRDGFIGADKKFIITFGGSTQINVAGVLVSSDGESWQIVQTDDPYVGHAISCAAYSPENDQIAALGMIRDTIIGIDGPQHITFDVNGDTWQMVNTKDALNNFHCQKMLSDGSNWIAIGGQGGVDETAADLIWISNDGINWSSVLSGAGAVEFSGIAKNDNVLVVVGRNALKKSSETGSYLGVIYTSYDGVSWSMLIDSEEKITNLWGVASSGERFLAIGSASGGYIRTYTSTDGANWINTDTRPPESTDNTGVPRKLIWGGDRFILLMSTGDILVRRDRREKL